MGTLAQQIKKWRKKDLEERVLNFNWNILSNMMNIVQPLHGACQFYMYKCIFKRILYKLVLFCPSTALNIDSGIALCIKIMSNVISTRVERDTLVVWYQNTELWKTRSGSSEILNIWVEFSDRVSIILSGAKDASIQIFCKCDYCKWCPHPIMLYYSISCWSTAVLFKQLAQ